MKFQLQCPKTRAVKASLSFYTHTSLVHTCTPENSREVTTGYRWNVRSISPHSRTLCLSGRRTTWDVRRKEDNEGADEAKSPTNYGFFCYLTFVKNLCKPLTALVTKKATLLYFDDFLSLKITVNCNLTKATATTLNSMQLFILTLMS